MLKFALIGWPQITVDDVLIDSFISDKAVATLGVHTFFAHRHKSVVILGLCTIFTLEAVAALYFYTVVTHKVLPYLAFTLCFDIT